MFKTSERQKFKSDCLKEKKVFEMIQQELFKLYRSHEIRTNSLTTLRKKYQLSKKKSSSRISIRRILELQTMNKEGLC